MSRIEELLQALLNGKQVDFEPESRCEKLLYNCVEGCGCEDAPEPESRIEVLLYALAEKMAGGSGSSGGEEKSLFAKYAEGTLTEITANDLKGATVFGTDAFSYNKKITKVSMPDTVSSVGSRAFGNCTNLKEVTLSKNVAMASPGLFSGCTKLENVYQMEQLIGFAEDMFMMCSSLKSITIPIGVPMIRMNNFSNCTSLVEVNLHNKITGIQTQAFYNCTSLTSLVIPSSVSSLGSSSLAIGSTSNKATITFLGTTPPTITTSTFNKNYLEKIIVPKGSLDTYKSATNWSNFADYIEEATE